MGRKDVEMWAVLDLPLTMLPAPVQWVAISSVLTFASATKQPSRSSPIYA